MKKMTVGRVGIRVLSRQDGMPLLQLKALNAEGRRLITGIHKELEAARFLGILKRKADIYNVCGSQGTATPHETFQLTIPLALGGADVRCHKRTRGGKKQ